MYESVGSKKTLSNIKGKTRLVIFKIKHDVHFLEEKMWKENVLRSSIRQKPIL
jgi:hypothetical protein